MYIDGERSALLALVKEQQQLMMKLSFVFTFENIGL
jgi:hypothetical protein